MRLLAAGLSQQTTGRLLSAPRPLGSGLSQSLQQCDHRKMASSATRDVEDLPSFCIPADGVHVPGCRWDARRRCCAAAECPALFTPPELRERQRQWAAGPQPPLVVVAAGPERSGSTWLYNALRLLFEAAEQPLDAYFLGDITSTALDARGAGRPGGRHLLIKTHRWSQAWDVRRASHVVLTHRDLRQVVASYRRLGWGSWLPRSYVADHMACKEHATLDLSFERITEQPEVALRQLAQHLGLAPRIHDYAAVLAGLAALPVPTGFMDPVTQLWPGHISTPLQEQMQAAASAAASAGSGGKGQQQEGQPAAAAGCAAGAGGGHGRQLSEGEAGRLLREHPAYFKLYGYH